MTRSPLRLAALAALALSTTLVAACGDDDGPSPSSRHTAMFVNETYIDWDTTSWQAWNAGSNAYAAVRHAGFPVDTFSGMTPADLHEHLAGKDILFFPELENTPAFDADGIDTLRAFVNSGGTVVAFSSGARVQAYNNWFDLSLTSEGSWSARVPIGRESAAGSTPFGAGPTSVPENDWTYYLTLASLPDSAIVAYGATGDIPGAAVVVIPYGEGRLVFFGWSWGDGKPKGVQDGGWNQLLTLTAGF